MNVNKVYFGYPEHVGAIRKWCSMDSEELYNKNKKRKKTKLLLESLDWLDTEFDYKFNKHGFRAEEFEEGTDNIMFLGCSFTLGLGLPLEKTWTHIVSSELGLKNYNLGIGAASNDTIFRFASYWIKALKPKYVVHMSTFKNRLEIFDVNNVPVKYTPRQGSYIGLLFFKSKYNAEFNELKNKKAIQQICNEANTNYIGLSIDNDWQRINNDLARDLAHPGVKSNQVMAERVLKLIEEEKNGN
jgi:hypothetical protein